MSWVAATTYRANIGGILYDNVGCPVALDDTCLLSITRHSDSQQLGATFELRSHNGDPVASVCNNEIALHDAVAFEHIDRPSRQVILERASGHVWCDIITRPSSSDYELKVSCRLFAQIGYPVLLHPDRSKFGKANGSPAHTVARMTLSGVRGGNKAAFRLEDSASLYLLGVAIENVDVGVRISHGSSYDT